MSLLWMPGKRGHHFAAPVNRPQEARSATESADRDSYRRDRRSRRLVLNVDAGMNPPSHRSGSRRGCARERALPNTRRLPSGRPCVRGSGAQIPDLARADQPCVARSMGGFIEPDADGDGYSECWLTANPASSSSPPAKRFIRRRASHRTCRRHATGGSRPARVCARRP